MSIRFILNPISGKRPLNRASAEACIREHFEDADICWTQAPGHAAVLAEEAARAKVDAVIAAGGDGTINETARGLVGRQTPLGIIPRGSGNGFAREIGMQLDFQTAVKQLKSAAPRPCDAGYANGELFLNVAGVGLEAEVAWQFMQYGKSGMRGKWPYFSIAAQTILTYQPPQWTLEADGAQMTIAPLTLVLANGRQYGSSFKIAPQASLNDGLLDLVVVQNVSKWKLALALPGFFTNKKPPFGVTRMLRVRHVRLTQKEPFVYHIDGEPRQTENTLDIVVQSRALNVLFPRKK